MRIAGFVKNSVIDYPEKLAAVVFTPGCNLDCYYCHNRFILQPETWGDFLPEEDVFRFLEKRRKLLDGVVITGGEPTLQKDLKGFIQKVKNLGYSIKLDTNGTNPELLKDLIDDRLLDYVAMDLKAPLAKYSHICGIKSPEVLEKIKESIKLLLAGQVTYEFRTTFVPELTQEDIEEMLEYIQGARLFVLQQYRLPELPNSELTKNKELAKRIKKLSAHGAKYIQETAQKAAEKVKHCEIRGI